MRNPDVVVIGAGFGGLATALRLAELGADVVLQRGEDRDARSLVPRSS
jgi:glycine/D-amino acid oxidase-like deaminating enzyme